MAPSISGKPVIRVRTREGVDVSRVFRYVEEWPHHRGKLCNIWCFYGSYKLMLTLFVARWFCPLDGEGNILIWNFGSEITASYRHCYWVKLPDVNCYLVKWQRTEPRNRLSFDCSRKYRVWVAGRVCPALNGTADFVVPSCRVLCPDVATETKLDCTPN
jgi:hypothetical protein